MIQRHLLREFLSSSDQSSNCKLQIFKFLDTKIESNFGILSFTSFGIPLTWNETISEQKTWSSYQFHPFLPFNSNPKITQIIEIPPSKSSPIQIRIIFQKTHFFKIKLPSKSRVSSSLRYTKKKKKNLIRRKKSRNLPPSNI